MLPKSLPVVISLLTAALAEGQTPTATPLRGAVQPPRTTTSPMWRKPSRVVQAAATSALDPGTESLAPLDPTTQPPLQKVLPVNRQPIARYTKGPGALPNDAGQEWRDYDITPYTTRVTSTNRPEQALVDWILRETGYEAWHGEPLGVLSASRRTLRVYHTREMQALVSEMVDRFVSTEAESHAFSLRVITVDNPNWRAKAHPMLQPVNAQSQGVQAWLLAKEDAALLAADLRRRTDFREHSSPHLLVNNGQSTVVAATRPRNYVRNVITRANTWPGFEPEVTQIDEGFSLEFSPLLSLDGRTIDAIIKCNVDQVEKMIPLLIEVATPVAPRQRTKVEVPQVNSCRLHERFRWPTEQVLLISMGVVASPAPKSSNPLTLALPLGATRADLLVIVESRGKLAAPIAASAPSAGPVANRADNYRGRY